MDEGVIPRGGQIAESEQAGNPAPNITELCEILLAHELKTVTRIGLTETLVYQMVLECMACCRAHIRLGNAKVAMWFLSEIGLMLIGVEGGFSQRVKQLGLSETEDLLRDLLDKSDVIPEARDHVLERIRARTQRELAPQVDPDGLELAPVFLVGEAATLAADILARPTDEDEQNDGRSDYEGEE
jgi:hypothetical protein